MAGPATAASRQLGVVLLCACVAVLAGTTAAWAQQTAPATADTTQLGDLYREETEFFRLKTAEDPLVLAHRFVDGVSLRLYVDGVAWSAGDDYRLRARHGLIIPRRPWLAADAGEALVAVRYRYLPVPVAPRLDLYAVHPPPGLGESQRASILLEGEQDGSDGSGYGNLAVRGSKAVYVSSGSRRELTVDQNLRLTISGQLTRDISVQAYLSDDNLPVVPEGTTEELSDIDKVLVEIRASNWQATLGDFVALRTGTVFGNYRRKLQGVSLWAHPGRSDFEFLAGSPRGRYRTLQIRGQEANQGPYFLGFGETGNDLFVVAGSEKVSLDGERMTRGADRDYVIDYVRGTVTFTFRRLITAESTIVVEYEEGEGPYGRSVVGAGGGLSYSTPLFSGGTGKMGFRLVEEKDDPNRSRAGDLSAEDEVVLRQAGDDPLAAVTGGVEQAAEPGQGEYDQVVEPGRTYYQYNPLGGDWIVTFFHVGVGLGDYELGGLDAGGKRVFVFRGTGQGTYRIGRPLSLPGRHRIMTATAAMGDTTGTYLRGEWNASEQDLNQLSSLDDGDNRGFAGQAAAAATQRLSIGDLSLGRVALRGSFEARDENFRSFVLHKTRFNYESWGLSEVANRPGFLDEREREALVKADWTLGRTRRLLEFTSDWGTLRHGPGIIADRLAAGIRWQLGGGRGRHRLETATAVARRDSTTVDAALNVRRRLQMHELSWDLGWLVPRGLVEDSWWRNDAASGEAAAGYRLQRASAGLASSAGRPFRWQVEHERARSDSLRSGDWQDERDSRTTRAQMTTPLVAGVRLDGSATLRQVYSPGRPDQITRLAKSNLAGRWQKLGSDWNWSYQVDNSRTEVLERRVVYVGERQGDYDRNGDFLGRNQGDYNVVTVGTDSLVATTRVESDLSWNQDFGWLGRDRIWGAWSSTTIIGVIGSSRTDNVRGLLTFDPEVLFDPEETVLAEVRLTEELAFLKHTRLIDLRLKYDFLQQRDRRFATTPEDRLNRSYLGTLTWSYGQRSNLKLRGQHFTENRTTAVTQIGSERSYDATTSSAEVEWSLRPQAGDRIATTFTYLLRDDAVSGIKQLEYAIRPSVRNRWGRNWTAQVDLRLAQVRSQEPPGALRPFFFSLPGRNVEASARLGWDPTRHLGVAVTYFARKQGDRSWQHDVRMETTARF